MVWGYQGRAHTRVIDYEREKLERRGTHLAPRSPPACILGRKAQMGPGVYRPIGPVCPREEATYNVWRRGHAHARIGEVAEWSKALAC